MHMWTKLRSAWGGGMEVDQMRLLFTAFRGIVDQQIDCDVT